MLGFARQRLEGRDRSLTVSVARLEHPFIVEVGQQCAFAERERLSAAPFGAEAFGLEHVDPGAVREADAVARRHERLGAERPPQCPERAAEARARTLVEHVGPEARRHGGPRVQARVERQPAEQRPRPARAGARSRRRRPRRRSHPRAGDPHHRQSVQRHVCRFFDDAGDGRVTAPDEHEAVPFTEAQEGPMDLYVILRRDGWRSADELELAAAAFDRRGRADAGRHPLDPQLRPRGGGRAVGTVCIYQASQPGGDPTPTRTRAGLPVDRDRPGRRHRDRPSGSRHRRRRKLEEERCTAH